MPRFRQPFGRGLPKRDRGIINRGLFRNPFLLGPKIGKVICYRPYDLIPREIFRKGPRERDGGRAAEPAPAMNAPVVSPIDQVSRIRIVIVCMMFGLSVMVYFDRTIMSIAGPTIIKEFGLSETGMGTVYSAFTLGYALLMIPGGRFADRFGPRKMLTFMALGSALFTAMTAVGARPGLGTY